MSSSLLLGFCDMKLFHINENRERIILLGCTLIICLLNIGTSPLIHAITADSALFMTMGRAMVSGKVLYRDIFDHKGLYIFLINGIGALISRNSMNGVFLVETVTICVDTFLVYQICRLFLKSKQSMFIALLFTAFSTNYFVFIGGNLVEEYALPFQLISLFLICNYLREGKSAHPAKIMFLHGICGGFCLWLRANLVMMWIPFALLVLCRELKEKRFVNFWKNIACGLAGIIVISLPVFAYGILNHCMEEMLYAAFTFNFQYTSAHGSGMLGNILATLFNKHEAVLLLLCAFSCIVLWKKRTPSFSLVLFVTMLCACFLAASLSGRAYWQYYVYLLPFTIPAFSWIAERICQKPALRTISPILIVGFGVCFGLIFPARILSLCFGRNITLYEQNRDDYRTAASLKEEYYPSSNNVLVTGGNSQFYVEMNVVPELRYPFALSMSYDEFPDPYDEQLNSIIDGRDDVVVLVNESYDADETVPIYDGLKEDAVDEALEQYYELVFRSETTGTRMYVRK